MLHLYRPIRPWMTRRRDAPRATARTWLRSWAALLIMLLAVVPHATLNAQAGHDRGQSLAMPAMHHAAMVAAASEISRTAPCHEDGDARQPVTHAMPACCIMGCAVMIATAAPGFAIGAANWRRIPAPQQTIGRSALTEPAERPPKSAA